MEFNKKIRILMNIYKYIVAICGLLLPVSKRTGVGYIILTIGATFLIMVSEWQKI